MRQHTILVASALAILLLAVGASPASAGPVRFSIQPTGAGANARGASYFSYAVKAGSVISDSAVVVNEGTDPITLIAYAADGVTATNGGTAFAPNGQHRDGTHLWIAVEVSTFSIPAGGRVIVPFILRVPADAKPSDHVAGIVVEAPASAPGTGGTAAAVVQRAGVAVVVRVPGEVSEKLVFGEVCVNRETGSNYVQLVASNQGTHLTKGTGTFTLTSSSGTVLFNRPVDVGTVLPGDATFLRLDAPVAIPSDRYTAAIAVTQTDGRVATLATPVTVVENANGCQKADSVAPPVAPRPAAVPAAVPAALPAAKSAESDGISGWLFLLFGVLLGALVAGTAVRLARR